MRCATVRVRSLAWFAVGAVLATPVTLLFANAWRVDAAPGDVDATFVPVTACRLADTRLAPAPIDARQTRTFTAHGANGDCAIPADAIALSMNVTVDNQTAANSFLTIWKTGAAQPNSSSLNPAAGEPPTPNAVTTDLSPVGEFNIYNDAGSVNVIIDVNGYYTKSSLQQVNQRLAALERQNAGNRLDALEDAQPFALEGRIASNSAEPAVKASVQVTADVAGQVTVNSTTIVSANAVAARPLCSITTGDWVDLISAQGWESPGIPGELAQLAGTRVFDIAAGATVTYNLACVNFGLGGTHEGVDYLLPVLTAIFTPERETAAIL